jgi:FtsP/CotA-like multicopper oxidase with cupredoxin domain
MHERGTTRRAFLRDGATALLGASVAGATACEAVDDLLRVPADVTLRIAPVELEIARGLTVHTVGYNGAAPGPVTRFREGVSSSVEIFNDSDAPEYVHWHGFDTSADLDGAMEEGSLAVEARSRLRYNLMPSPAGCRYVHTHSMAMSDLNRGTFTGQFAFAWVEPRNNPGRYDQEVFLATHEWNPYLISEEPGDGSPQHSMPPAHPGRPLPHNHEVAYRHFTINGKCLGFGDPIRVKRGERVLFHFLNASATENVRFALPGHAFRVIALDGNRVPRPQLVHMLELGTAERIDAIVTMNNPGVSILGTPNDSHRRKGMGIVVEYANRRGQPVWLKPPNTSWDYSIFGENHAAARPDSTVPLVIRRRGVSQSGFEQWTINGKSWEERSEPDRLALGKAHRLVITNESDDDHPVHLHRNSFELADQAGKPTAGIVKDVVVVKSRQTVGVNVTPSQPGLTLFHCHQQLHMDNGFKMLFNVT